ncbi:hypothetical protein L6452_00439 [Arctium lappa]|uniref:Uncharacterized protein n=1 Tax=Arctium lappa TaxID=4217 RepID=A0ACB9FEW3_ARCLA|nr:hypothetical protein L6452_00439 [Arctium lappa]
MRYWSSSFIEVNNANGNLVNATLEIVETEYVDNYFKSLRCHLSNSDVEPTLDLDILRYNSTLSYLRLGSDRNLRLYSYRQNTRGNAWNLLFTLLDRGVSERGGGRSKTSVNCRIGARSLDIARRASALGSRRWRGCLRGTTITL